MIFTRRRSLAALAGAAAQWRSAEGATKAPPVQLVVLDVGGTIIEDRGDVPQTLKAAMANHGVNASIAEIDQFRGAAKRDIIRRFAKDEAVAEKIYQEFSRSLIEIYRTVPPIAGAEQAIQMLRQSGYLVAVNTGFDREIAVPIFRRLGWQSYFAASVCSDDVAEGRPAPYMIFHAMETARVHSVAEVVVVGDTPLDMQSGTNSGARAVVGVLTGTATRDRLSAEPHTHIVPSVAAIPELLKKL